MLARALSDVEVGFYIDVGAQDPDEGSVTKHFYDRGWKGLNFEPSENYHARLSTARPRDLTLRCALGDRAGSVTFYELADTGLSTIIEAVTESFPGSRIEHTVPMMTLDGACAAYGIDTVHFLKIDVEGAEELVLRGTRFETVRPWIVVVEATRPNSTEPHYAHWEPLLTERNYRFVYADGLNRFYLAEEQAHRAAAFALPPNYFDGFVLAGEARALDNLNHHLGIIDRLGEQVSSQQEVLESQVSHLGEINRRAEAQHVEILRLIELLDAATEREKAGIAHHVGLLDAAAEREKAGIAHHVGLLDAAAEREKTAIAHHVGLLQEASERAETQHVEILRLVSLIDAAAEREKAGLAHHVGLLQQAAEHSERQHIEIERLVDLLQKAAERADVQQTEVLRLADALAAERQTSAQQTEALRKAESQANAQQAKALREAESQASALAGALAEIERRDRQLAELGALAIRQSRQIAFRDDKISWITQDRDRFRARYKRTIASLSWRVTRPLRWGQKRSPVYEAPLPGAVSELAGTTEPTAAIIETPQETDSGPSPTIATLPEPLDLPEPARWFVTALQPLPKT